VVNGCTHCTPENTHWTPGIIASNGCAGATPAHPAQTSGARASGAYPGRDAPAPQELPRAQGGASARTLSRFAHQDAQTLPSPRVAEGGRGDEGGKRARECPRTRRTPQVRAPPARTPAETLQPRRSFHALREGSARTLSCFRHQDAQTPPSPRVGEGGRGDEGANAHTQARRPRT
jgi:hypothetical protein